MGSKSKKSTPVENGDRKKTSSSQPSSKVKPSAPKAMPTPLKEKKDKVEEKKKKKKTRPETDGKENTTSKSNKTASALKSDEKPASTTSKKSHAPKKSKPSKATNGKPAHQKSNSEFKPSHKPQPMSDSDSDSDDSDPSEPMEKSKAETVKPSTVQKAKAVSSDDSDSDDSDSDDAPIPKAAPLDKKKSFGPTPTMVIESDEESDDSDSSGDEEVVKPVKPTPPAPTKARALKTDEESSDDDSDDSKPRTLSDSDDSSDDSGSDPLPEAELPKNPAPVKGDKKRQANDEDSSAKKPKTNGASGGMKNVFVRGLSWNIDEAWLRSEFEHCGTILSLRVIVDRETQKSKGFGYVDFDTAEAAHKAVEMMNGAELDGRTIAVELAAPKAEKPRFENRAYGEEPSQESQTIFVGNLPFSATNDNVYDVFAEFGDITSVRLPTDPETERPKGFGYVEFSTLEAAKVAVGKGQGEGIFVDGRQVRLDYSLPRSGGGGDRGGRFGSRGGDRGRGFGGRGGRGGGFSGRGGDRGGGRGARGGGRGGRGGGDHGWGSRAKMTGAMVEPAGTKKKF